MTLNGFDRMLTWGWTGLALACLTGCYDTSLPEKQTVPMSPARSIEADADTGPFSLAGTHWRMYGTRVVYQSTGEVDDNGGEAWVIADIAFGERGEVVSVTLGDVYARDMLIKDWLGETLYPDTIQHPAASPEATYVAESYGGSDGDAIAITILLRYFVGPLQGFTASISVSGTLSQDRTRIEGTMTLVLSFDTEVWEADPSLADTFRIEYYAEAL